MKILSTGYKIGWVHQEHKLIKQIFFFFYLGNTNTDV